MGKSAPKAPEPVDPTKTIAAQTASNEAAARLQQQLGMIGTYGPGGSVTYRADPNSPGGYSQYTELDPSQQAIYDRSNQAQVGALGIANDQLGRISSALSQQLTPPQLQESFGTGAPIQTSFNAGPGLRYGFNQGGQVTGSFDQGGPLQSSFNTGQAVQGNVGPTDFSADREAVTNGVIDQARSRLDPMWNQAEDKNRLRLANQGLSANSTAYQNSMGDFGRAKNDAYNQAIYSGIQAGSDQQQRLFDQAVQQGNFANNAAGQQYAQNMGAANFGNQTAAQQYAQNLGAAQFGNQATAQRYGQNLGAAQFGNQAAGQQFGQNQSQAGFNNAAAAQQFGQNQDAANFGNAARQANFSNLAYAQNQPINQFQALLGTGQLQMPGAYSGPTAGVSPADVVGAYGLYQQGLNNNYNAQVSNVNSQNQGIGQLGSAALSALILSDRRMKKDIRKLGQRADGIGLYAFRYKAENDNAPLRFGVMADEVERVRPEAVTVINGIRHVDYAQL